MSWGVLNMDVQTPDTTNVSMAVRSGNTATPDGTWSAWAPVADGADMPAVGRYLQYRASLGTTNTGLTPVLEEVRLAIGDPPPVNDAPTITNPGLADRHRR